MKCKLQEGNFLENEVHFEKKCDTLINKKVVNILKEKQMSLSLVESATGGMIASSIVDVEGASEVFRSSYVLYQDTAKLQMFDIENIILKHTSVSMQTSKVLVDLLFHKTKSDILLSVTGYADKGVFYICLKNNSYIKCQEFNFNYERNENRKLATYEALNMIYHYLGGLNVR